MFDDASRRSVGSDDFTIGAVAREAADVTVDYPAHLVDTWTASDGTSLVIRPIRIGDEAIETTFIHSVSAATGYQRFLSPRIPQAAEIERFTHIDYDHEMALVAIDERAGGERLCGVARYVRDETGDAEFAIVLADDWQRRGLGAHLMHVLIAAAKEAGVKTLSGITSSTNAGMLTLARRLGFAVAREPGDATVSRLSLTL